MTRHTRDRGARVMDAIDQFTAAHGHPPSLRDLAARVGLRSPSAVHHLLQRLEARGLVEACSCGCGRFHTKRSEVLA